MNAVAAEQVEQLLRRLELLGLDSEEVCQQARVDRARLREPGTRVPVEWFSRLAATAAALSKDPLLGLHAGETSIHDFFDYLAMAQPTVEAGFEVFARYARLAADGLRAEVRKRGAYSWIHVEFDSDDSVSLRHLYEYLAALLVRNYRASIGEDPRVSEVRFPHARQGPQAEYERVLGSTVRFDQQAFAVGLPTDALAQRHEYPSPQVAHVLGEEARQRLALVSAGDFATGVALAVRRACDEGTACTPESVAHVLGVGARTLQRRLRQQRKSFREVRDAVRCDVASGLLRRPSLQVSEVAEKLGFADVAAFDKAFKRWTGKTPRAFRHEPHEAGDTDDTGDGTG